MAKDEDTRHVPYWICCGSTNRYQHREPCHPGCRETLPVPVKFATAEEHSKAARDSYGKK